MPDGERVTTGSEPRRFTLWVHRKSGVVLRDPDAWGLDEIEKVDVIEVESGHDGQTRDTKIGSSDRWDERTVAAVVEALREEREPQFNLAATWIENDPRFKPSAPGGDDG
jgi:hypothetical protein